VRYVARHGRDPWPTVLISAVPPLMFEDGRQSWRLPIDVLDGLRRSSPPTGRSSTSISLSGPFYATTPGATASPAVIWNWSPGHDGVPRRLRRIKAFSETDFTRGNLKASRLRPSSAWRRRDQIVPVAASAPLSAKL